MKDEIILSFIYHIDKGSYIVLGYSFFYQKYYRLGSFEAYERDSEDKCYNEFLEKHGIDKLKEACRQMIKKEREVAGEDIRNEDIKKRIRACNLYIKGVDDETIKTL